MRQSAGFTLIEMMITLVVALILVTWAVPNFQTFIDRSKLTSEANSWVGVINYARSEAITRSEKVTICRRIDPGTCDGSANCDCGVTQSGGSSPPNYHTGYLIFTSTDNTGSPLNFRPGMGDELLRTGQAHSDKITIQGNGQANNAFSFMPDGTLASEDINSVTAVTARHILCVERVADDGSTAQSTSEVPGRVVIISATGRPRVMGFEEGGACFDPDSSNAAADSSTDYGN